VVSAAAHATLDVLDDPQLLASVRDLGERLAEGLRALPGVRVWSRARHRTPTLLMTFDGRDAADAYRFLATRGVNAPPGNFYAIEASRWLGLGDAGGLRVGLSPYSDDGDVDRLLAGQIRHDDMGPRFLEAPTDREPDPACPARGDGHAPVERQQRGERRRADVGRDAAVRTRVELSDYLCLRSP
jgi:hypothetical protein